MYTCPGNDGSARVDFYFRYTRGNKMDSNTNKTNKKLEKNEEVKKATLDVQSESDTASSHMSVTSLNSMRRYTLRPKRSLKETSWHNEVSSDEGKLVPTVGLAAKRGRKKPPTTSRSDSAKDQIELQVLSADTETEIMLTTELNSRVLDAVSAIKQVAKATKGRSQKALIAAADFIEKATGVLAQRTSSEEVAKLRAENVLLVGQMTELRKQQEELRSELQKIRKDKTETEVASEPNKQDSNQLNQLIQAVSNLNARFSFIESRILRPPLAADKNGRSEGTFATVASQLSKAGAPSQQVPSQKSDNARTPVKGKGKGKKSIDKAAPILEVVEPNPTSIAIRNDEWQVAGAKKVAKKAKKNAKKADKEAKQKLASLRARLRVPRSSAVMITLPTDPEQKGLSYRDVIAKAKSNINLEELGITDGIRWKSTATGSKMLEIPGTTSGPQADALAEKLIETLGAEGVKIFRPTKRVSLRILGLDDSITSEELVAAVSRAGGCSPAQVKTSTITEGFSGSGTAVLSCPVEAAKKLLESGRLLVGRVSAQVKIIQPRPTRCYLCLMEGHIGVQCTKRVGSSALCFRCGQAGHKAATCTATPHCILCAAAGKPAEHPVGLKYVLLQKTRGKFRLELNRTTTTHRLSLV